MYETVTKWLGADPAPANKVSVLTGWLSLLNKHATAPVQTGDCHRLIYQMIHRAASAVAVGQEPGVAYFVFKPTSDQRSATPEQIYERLFDLWKLIGYPSSFPCHVVEIGMTDTLAFAPLRGLPKGKEATADVVRAALQDVATPMFTFGGIMCRTVANKA